MEKQFLNASMSSRTSFSLIKDSVSPEAKNKKDVRYTQEFRILMGKIEEYYENDSAATSVSLELMEQLIDASVPNDKHKERFKNILREAMSSDVSVPNINALIRMAKRHELGDKLAQRLINRDDVDELLAAYNKAVAEELLEDAVEDGAVRGTNLQALLNKAEEGGDGIKLRPKALNDAIGGRGVRRGSKVTMFGRPEIAKSAWCITNACGWAMDGLRVLYLVNEDPAETLFFRALCCLTGMTEAEIMEDPDKAMEIARRRGIDNLIFKDIHPGSIPEIDALVEKENPDVVVLDQLRNITSKADSRTNQLDEVARQYRDVGKARGILTVDVTQAGESAEGKSVLTMTDIDSSKTGVPGAADILIGIGATKEQEAAGYRTLSLCKNKVNGNHSNFTVKLNPAISRYSDV